MREIVLITAALFASAQAAHATEYKWIGTTVVTATTGCSGGWDPKGVVLNTLFRLPVVGSTNGPDSDFNIFDKTWATGFHLAGGKITSTFKLVDAAVVGSDTDTYQASIKFASQAPATIATATPFVTISGNVNDFDFRTGCNIAFKSSLTKSPF
jgi:hypothetical protein